MSTSIAQTNSVMLVDVFRLEFKDTNLSPFQVLHTQNQILSDQDEDKVHHIVDGFRYDRPAPLWNESARELKTERKFLRQGFISLEQLNEFFSDEDLDILLELGFVCRKYILNIDDVSFDQGQIVFNNQKVIGVELT